MTEASPLRDFESFVRMVFRQENDGEKLGDEPYIQYICQRIAKVRDGGARLVINMPPRHLKTTIGTVALAAWLLALNPAEKIIVVTYSGQLANDIGYRTREIMRAAWYQRHFSTRLAGDRASVTDFATTTGGGVYATSVDGSFIGRGATVVIFDDPHDMDDANDPEKLAKVVERFGSAIMSRLNNSTKDRAIINAHRIHPNDISGYVIKLGGWEVLQLPFLAMQDELYRLPGDRTWFRKKGELLRPDAFSDAEITRIKSLINPDFEALYQQYAGGPAVARISGERFGIFTVVPPDLPVVISVDPGHRAGPENSFTVMQAWVSTGGDFLLLDQWREQADLESAIFALRSAVANCRPAAVIIEYSGFGQTLARELGKRHPKLDVRLISPGHRSKIARLMAHIDVIENGHIKLPANAAWRPALNSEFEQFPNGQFDDQVDTMTLYLDFMLSNPTLKRPPARALGGVMNKYGRFTSAVTLARIAVRPGYVFSPQRSMTRIFPRRANAIDT